MMTGLAYFGCPYAARTHFSYDFVGSSPQLTDGKTDYCFPQRFVDITRVLFPTPRLRRRVKGECRLLHFQINHITMPPQTRALLFAMNSSIFFCIRFHFQCCCSTSAFEWFSCVTYRDVRRNNGRSAAASTLSACARTPHSSLCRPPNPRHLTQTPQCRE